MLRCTIWIKKKTDKCSSGENRGLQCRGCRWRWRTGRCEIKNAQQKNIYICGRTTQKIKVQNMQKGCLGWGAGWRLEADSHLTGSSLGSFSPESQWDRRWGSRSWAACTCSANILPKARSAPTRWWSQSRPSGSPCGLPRHGSLSSTPEDDVTRHSALWNG